MSEMQSYFLFEKNRSRLPFISALIGKVNFALIITNTFSQQTTNNDTLNQVSHPRITQNLMSNLSNFSRPLAGRYPEWHTLSNQNRHRFKSMTIMSTGMRTCKEFLFFCATLFVLVQMKILYDDEIFEIFKALVLFSSGIPSSSVVFTSFSVLFSISSK